MALRHIAGDVDVGSCCICDTYDPVSQTWEHIEQHQLWECTKDGCDHMCCEKHREPCGYCTGCCAEEHGLGSHT